MKIALTLVGAALAGTGFAPAAPVTIEYSPARLARDGRTIAWTWTVRNTGASVGDLTVVHRLRPRLDVVAVTPGCAATAGGVRCGYGALPAGGRRTGRLVARVPDGAKGTVRIGGTVTWRRAAPR
ncbi:hypothetical protein [Actinomadura rayongensis]|uniref:DUF11 domain-containing protein n=1 Tax=Actinomadura rayongensis TaxID=1429076 RepID=A0A6I4WAV8_9ACTN|nr:hypothetical protein [Actinomadura rayongensis]MXQ65900.1 hypothetical protein [Actinomadura rayongensis]